MSPGWRLNHAVRLLRAGRLVAHPTEGVWGLACDPLLPEAVLRVLAAKRRDPAKGLIVIAHEFAALTPLLDAPAGQIERAQGDWPGPVTWVLPAAPEVPWWLTGDHDTLAVRVTAHPVAAALCRAFGGPLVSTSANLAGHPPPRHPWQVRAQLGAAVDLTLAGELETPGRPSTIRDGATGDVIRG